MVSFRITLRREIGWRLLSSFLLLVFSCLQPDADELGQTGTRTLTQALRGPEMSAFGTISEKPSYFGQWTVRISERKRLKGPKSFLKN